MSRSSTLDSLLTNAEWEQRDLLPGISGNAWAGWGLWSFAICTVSAILLLFGALAAHKTQQWDPYILSSLGIFAASFGAGWLFLLISNVKTRKEIAAGYTTSTTGDNQVERRHSPTGVVMRAAGEPNLTKPRWEAAMRRVRAYEEHQKRERAKTSEEPG